MPVSYYRVSDPIENLKIQVRVRAIPRVTNHVDERSISAETFDQEYTLSWQQKIYSPNEIADYVKRNNLESRRARTVAQAEARRYLGNLESNGRDIPSMIAETMIYTYVMKDHKSPASNPIVVNRTEHLALDTDAAVRTSDDEDEDEVYQSSVRNHLIKERETEYSRAKTMYICMATDVDTKNLRSDKPYRRRSMLDFTANTTSLDNTREHGQKYFEEHVLCSISLLEDGVLEVSPAFSAPEKEQLLGETYSDTWTASGGGGFQENSVALSAFLDDRTAKMAIKKGFRLSTFRVQSLKSGIEYEYIIRNVNDLYIPYKIEEINRFAAIENAIKVRERRQVLAGSSTGVGLSSLHNATPTTSVPWNLHPPKGGTTVLIYAEIVSGVGFDGNRIYLNYQMQLPQWNNGGWFVRRNDFRSNPLPGGGAYSDFASKDMLNNRLSGSDHINQQQAVGASQQTSSYVSATLYNDTQSGTDDMLNGTTHVARVSRNGEFHFSLPEWRRRWRGVSFPTGLSTLFCGGAAGGGSSGSILALGRMSRIIFGLVFMVSTGIAVVLGPSYPFWIVPALVVLFVLGTGTPPSGGAGLQAALLEIKDKKRAFKLRSHIGARHVEGSLMSNSTAAFNHLLNYTLDVIHPTPAVDGVLPRSDNPQQSPSMLLQVYSLGWFGRSRLEGYGYLSMPKTCGPFDVEISTWKPISGVHSRMNDYFLGNSVRLKSDQFAGIPNTSVPILNKFGMLTTSSGKIRIRGNVIFVKPSASVSLQSTGARGSDLSDGVPEGTEGDGSASAKARRVAALRRAAGRAGGAGTTPAAGSGTDGSTDKPVRRSVEDILQSLGKGNRRSTRALSPNPAVSTAAMGAPARAAPSADSKNAQSSDPAVNAIAVEQADTGRAAGEVRSDRPPVGSIMEALNANAKASRVAEVMARTKTKSAKAAKKQANSTTASAASARLDDDAPAQASEEGQLRPVVIERERERERGESSSAISSSTKAFPPLSSVRGKAAGKANRYGNNVDSRSPAADATAQGSSWDVSEDTGAAAGAGGGADGGRRAQQAQGASEGRSEAAKDHATSRPSPMSSSSAAPAAPSLSRGSSRAGSRRGSGALSLLGGIQEEPPQLMVDSRSPSENRSDIDAAAASADGEERGTGTFSVELNGVSEDGNATFDRDRDRDGGEEEDTPLMGTMER